MAAEDTAHVGGVAGHHDGTEGGFLRWWLIVHRSEVSIRTAWRKRAIESDTYLIRVFLLEIKSLIPMK